MTALRVIQTKQKTILAVALLSLLVLTIPSNVASASILNGILMQVVNVLFGWMVWFGGMLLDYAVNTMVIGFGGIYTGPTGLGYTIDRLWVMVRDIFNLGFIFGLVFIGLKMIFDSNNPSTKRNLITLIIAALLVNFSLLITKVIIDFANVAAEQIALGFPTVNGQVQISGSFMQLLGLNNIWNLGGNIENMRTMSGGAGLGFIFGSMFLYIIAAFVFIAGALLLIIRFVALNLYMLFSPLMFLGWVFPSLANITSQYWTGFLSRAFVAPVYLLMLYFSHQILSTFSLTGGQHPGMQSIFGPGGGATFVQVIPPFVLTAIFLVASIIMAQKLSSVGAGAVGSLQDKMVSKVRSGVKKGFVTGLAVGTYLPRAAGRAAGRGVAGAARNRVNTLGEWSRKKFENYQTKTPAAGAGIISRAASSLAKTNYVDRRAQAAFKSMEEAQLGTGTTKQAEEKYGRGVQARIAQTTAENQRAEDFTAGLETLDEAMSGTTKTAEDITKAIENMGKAMKNMTLSEKENLGFDKLTNTHVAAHLSDSDLEHFEKSGAYSAQQIKLMKDARKEARVSIAQAGSTVATKSTIGGRTTYTPVDATVTKPREDMMRQNVKEAGKLPVEVFTEPNMAEHITPQALEERLRNGGVSDVDQATIVRNLNRYLTGLPLSSGKRAAWANWRDKNTYGIGFGLDPLI